MSEASNGSDIQREASEFVRVESFAQLSEAALAALQDAAETRSIKGGEYLVRYGDNADTLYLVATGRFYVQLPSGAIVAEIEAGGPVGELAFFAGGTRTADVRATRDSSVLALSREAYDRVAGEYREIGEAILAEVSWRLARTTSFSKAMEAKPGRVVAILPAAGSTLPEGFAERLDAAMERYDAPRLIRSTDLPSEIDPESEAFGRWIGELERNSGRILLRANDSDKWNHAIARNADDLLLVAPLESGDSARSDLEDFAIPLFLRANRMLILWRDRSSDLISGSERWLDSRRVKLHHHIALDSDADFQRVARFMSGKANGVVLAGGGALGCAHIGVMQALIENGIPIDYYGGTSAGAAMAGALARGFSAEETLAQVQEMFIAERAMKRVTIPVHSFLDPHVFDEQLRQRYGTQDIADLPFNYFGVSTNLSTNDKYVHRRGPLWEAVRASGSLPTILPPFITKDGDILVDGGVLDNIPVEIMREAKAGPNVVVVLRADTGTDWRIKATYDDVRSPMELLRDIVLRRKPEPPFPSLIEIMSRSMVVASEGVVENNLARADALLIPPIPEDMEILDWHLGQDVAEAARVFTAQQIEQREELAAMRV